MDLNPSLIRGFIASAALVAGLVLAESASADPSDTRLFPGCILEAAPGRLILMTSDVPTTFDTTRMAPSDAVLAAGECVTVRAYPAGTQDRSVWFAESVVAGDERIETSGRDVTKETTSDSATKKKQNDDD